MSKKDIISILKFTVIK